MNSVRSVFVTFLLIIGIGVAPLFGQDLVTAALNSFPSSTIRMEYSSPATLRRLPNYASLRQHYMGPRLKELVSSMAELGVAEDDVDQLVLGWDLDGSNVNLYGFAGGHFRSSVLEARAAVRHIPPQKIGNKTGYCLGAGLATECVVVLSPSEGVFGTLGSLSQIMQNLNLGGSGLSSNADFARVVQQEQAQTGSPIWGVATASAVASWFKGWMPKQNEVELDWAKVFEGVNILGYNIDTGSNVKLNLKLFCKSAEAAGSLRQVLEGLKLAQQIAWQNQNPNQPNPFQNMELTQTGSQIGINLTADYADIMQGGKRSQ